MQSIYRYDAGQAVVNGVILVATQVVAEAGKGGDCKETLRLEEGNSSYDQRRERKLHAIVCIGEGDGSSHS